MTQNVSHKKRNPSGSSADSADWWPALVLVPEKKNDFQEFLAPAPVSMEVKPQRPPSPFLPCLVSDATGKNECFAFLLDFHPFEHPNANKFNRALQSKFKSCYPQVSCLSYNMAAFLAPSVVVKSIDTTRVAFGCNLPLGMRTKGEISSGWRFSSKLALRVITAWAPTDRHPPHHLVDRRNLRLELRSKVAGGPYSIQIALHIMLFGEHPLDH